MFRVIACAVPVALLGCRGEVPEAAAAAQKPPAELFSGVRGMIVADANPVRVCEADGLGVATLRWVGDGKADLEVRVGTPGGALFSRSAAAGGSASTERWVADGTTFLLVDSGGGQVISEVKVGVVRTGCDAGSAVLP